MVQISLSTLFSAPSMLLRRSVTSKWPFAALAECRKENSAGPADCLPEDPFQPFILAYYGLRLLKCREQRCRLLRCLEFLSERPMKTCSTQATRQWTRSAGRLTRQCSECHLPDFTSELSSFDLEPERFKCEEASSSVAVSGGRGCKRQLWRNSRIQGKRSLLIGCYCIRKKRKVRRAGVLQGFDGERLWREGWLDIAEGVDSVSPPEHLQHSLTFDASEVEGHIAHTLAGLRPHCSDKPWATPTQRLGRWTVCQELTGPALVRMTKFFPDFDRNRCRTWSLRLPSSSISEWTPLRSPCWED